MVVQILALIFKHYTVSNYKTRKYIRKIVFSSNILLHN